MRLFPKITPSQIELIRLRVGRVAFDEPALVLAGQFQLQLLRDLARDGLFDRNHIRNLAVVGCAPKLRAADASTKSTCTLNASCICRTRPVRHGRDFQLASYLSWIDVFAPVMKSGRARDHAQLLQLRQAID